MREKPGPAPTKDDDGLEVNTTVVVLGGTKRPSGAGLCPARVAHKKRLLRSSLESPGTQARARLFLKWPLGGSRGDSVCKRPGDPGLEVGGKDGHVAVESEWMYAQATRGEPGSFEKEKNGERNDMDGEGLAVV